jgi:hypothetical protein
MRRQDHPVHSVDALGAFDDPADNREYQDGNEDQCSKPPCPRSASTVRDSWIVVAT